MPTNKHYVTKDKYGNNRYDNITAQDRKTMRRAHNQSRPLTITEKKRIFGNNPTFIHR